MAVLSGEELCSPTLDGTATVHTLKKEILQLAGVPVEQQRLLVGKRVLKDASLLEDVAAEAKVVEVSLLKVAESEDVLSRQRHFDQFLAMGSYYGRDTTRFEFHKAHAITETDLDRGFSRESRLYVTLRQDDSHAATFNLCSLDFPLRELFDTFAEQSGAPVAELRFTYQGRRLTREDTPHLCGMEPCKSEVAHVIEVSREDALCRRRRLLAVLNKTGESVKLTPPGEDGKALALGADGLLRSLLFLPIEDLLQTTMASSFWFHATQRLSLMLQLRHGDVAFGDKPPEEYKAWLSSVFGHSQQLALAEARSRRQEAEAWQGLHMAKEIEQKKAYSFCKAAGCTTMKTVALSGLSQEFEQQWLALHSSKVKFMAECQAWCAEHEPDAPSKDLKAIPRRDGRRQEAPPKAISTQEIPAAVVEAASNGRYATAEATSPQFRAVAVELFRRYFSPDMYFIFPLIVGQEAAFGLDFRSTTTTLFFGPKAIQQRSVRFSVPDALQSPTGSGDAAAGAFKNGDEAKAQVAPAGACSWRFRWPPELEGSDGQGLSMMGSAAPLPLLEVLFIAVWEEEREQVNGGTLVGEIEAQAKAAGVRILYVEIGFEQPKARRFWRKQGFGKVVRQELGEEEKERAIEAEENEEVPLPLIPLADAQLAFFESHCLRFSDTAQYVKLLD